MVKVEEVLTDTIVLMPMLALFVTSIAVSVWRYGFYKGVGVGLILFTVLAVLLLVSLIPFAGPYVYWVAGTAVADILLPDYRLAVLPVIVGVVISGLLCSVVSLGILLALWDTIKDKL